MKNTKNKILLISLGLLSVFGFVATAQAAGNYLFASPAASTVNAGASMTTSVAVGTSGDKICAVQGTVVFNNLTCKSITLANGLMAQDSPSCSSPSFVIGIPKCTTTGLTLFTVSSKSGSAGTASISFSGVNLVGVGASVGTASVAGNYTITAAAVKTTTQTPVTAITQSTDEVVTQNTEPVQQTVLPGNAQTAALANTGASQWFTWILLVLVILLVIYVIYSLATRKRKVI